MKNYGFIPSVIDETHYVLGGFSLTPKLILQPDCNWKSFLPKWESQLGNFDTFGCTVFGSLNAVETILNKLNSLSYDYSERYIYILANVVPPGSDPHLIAETIRKQGLVPQIELPFTDTLDEFMKPKPMTNDHLESGQKFLEQYDFKHEWVFTSYQGQEKQIGLIKEALQYSPVCVSVSAWYEVNGVFVDNGLPNNHWTLCYGIDDDGGLLIFDSYALIENGVVTNALKKLSPNHKVMMAKRYYIQPKPYQEKLNWIETILKAIKEALGLIQKVEPITKPTIKQSEINLQPIDQPTLPTTNNVLLWDTPINVRHSCRVIMDKYNFTKVQKDLLCAIIQSESGFNTRAVNVNKNGSRDIGIVQMNDAYWIGKGKYFENEQEVYDNPEKSVHFMCKAYIQGHLNWWYGYTNGSYKRWL